MFTPAWALLGLDKDGKKKPRKPKKPKKPKKP